MVCYSSLVLNGCQVAAQPGVCHLSDLPRVSGTHLQVYPEGVTRSSLAMGVTLASFIFGKVPAYVEKKDRRYKTKSFAGAAVKSRGAQSARLLDAMRALMFYYLPDFRGVTQPDPNESISLRVVGFDYIVVMGDCIFYSCYGIDTGAFYSYLTISLTTREQAPLIARGLKFPALPAGA